LKSNDSLPRKKDVFSVHFHTESPQAIRLDSMGMWRRAASARNGIADESP
jgi:hypothetical protein